MRLFDRWKEEWWFKHQADLEAINAEKILKLEKENRAVIEKKQLSNQALVSELIEAETDLCEKLEVVEKETLDTKKTLSEIKSNFDVTKTLIEKQFDKECQEKLKKSQEILDEKLKEQETKNASELSRLKVMEEEIQFRESILADRKLELIKADNELKDQIRLLEAKASPSAVWCEAFSQGMSKAWDFLLPGMQENMEKLKKKIHDDAIADTLERLNGHHKTHR